MDKAYIGEHQLIARYVRGGLAGDDLATFEIYMLEHPEILDEIEFERGMQDALHRAGDKLVSNSPSMPVTVGRTRALATQPFAIAASLLAAVSLTFSVYVYTINSGLREEIASLSGPALLTAEVWIEPVRGEREWLIENRQGSAVLLRVDVSGTPATSYAVTLRGDQNGVVWNQSGIMPDEEQSIGLLLNRLPPGRYQLSIHVDGSDAVPVSEYSLLLQPPTE